MFEFTGPKGSAIQEAVKSDTPAERYDYLIERLGDLVWTVNLATQADGGVSIVEQMVKRNGAAGVSEVVVPVIDQLSHQEVDRIWLKVLDFYRAAGRNCEALAIANSHYNHLLQRQGAAERRVHKGTPLVMLGQCYHDLNCVALAKRYLMLSLMEDAIQTKGRIVAEASGCYFRLVWFLGLEDALFWRYVTDAWKLRQTYFDSKWFPEALLQQIDAEWMTEAPSAQEVYKCPITKPYVKHLLKGTGDTDGKAWEKLGRYLMWCMPGCRVYGPTDSRSTDYDIVCSVDGIGVDFRSELGRYFICECKTRRDADGDRTGFSDVAKFCRVLDSVKAKFGILFARRGVSGAGRDRWAAQEITKVYQDRGIVLVVIEEADIAAVSDGANFITLLRRKYETVRLDIMVPQA